MSNKHNASPYSIWADSTVGEIVAARPLLARVFGKLGIDFCCGGKRTVAAACERKGLDTAATLALLESSTQVPDSDASAVDAAAIGLVQLADHIVATHHSYLKEELPRLVEMAERVATKHGWRDPRLKEVAEAVHELASEMFCHMQKEEIVLFPIVRQIATGTPGGPGCGQLARPIHQMEVEHDAAGNLTRRLRELTDGFTPDGDACNTHRALLAGLEQFESDLHWHIHKENNILFPRALAMAKEA